MPKKHAKKRLKYVRIATACEQCGVPWSTLRSAIDRGEIDTAETADRLVLVDPDSAQAWAAAADTRRPGRKPKAG